ncbi:TatD family deoxyribonuclease [Lactobacillus sp. XV13L]|nr:TatD family deoxyribonuclease [Lactobacillus sp. XV13L]
MKGILPMLTDAHCHLEKNAALAKMQSTEKITAVINCQTPAEWAVNEELTERSQPMSFGIHPWDADKFAFSAALPYLEQADAVGEIGLDRVWTHNSLDLQKQVFVPQVQWAQKNQKPVILHTKGCEAEILQTIRQYPNRYLIHWYDCPNYQQEYIAEDCYFSICLAVLSDPSVTALARRVPLDRLVIETDGLGSTAWLLGHSVAVQEYPLILKKTIAALARLRQIDATALTTQLEDNLNHFIG